MACTQPGASCFPIFLEYTLVTHFRPKGSHKFSTGPQLKIGFKNTYFQVFQGFPALKGNLPHIQPNGKFSPVFGQNGQNGENYQKSAWNIFVTLISPQQTAKFQKNKPAILGLSTNLNLIKFLVFKRIKGITGIKILPNHLEIANVYVLSKLTLVQKSDNSDAPI